MFTAPKAFYGKALRILLSYIIYFGWILFFLIFLISFDSKLIGRLLGPLLFVIAPLLFLLPFSIKNFYRSINATCPSLGSETTAASALDSYMGGSKYFSVYSKYKDIIHKKKKSIFRDILFLIIGTCLLWFLLIYFVYRVPYGGYMWILPLVLCVFLIVLSIVGFDKVRKQGNDLMYLFIVVLFIAGLLFFARLHFFSYEISSGEMFSMNQGSLIISIIMTLFLLLFIYYKFLTIFSDSDDIFIQMMLPFLQSIDGNIKLKVHSGLFTGSDSSIEHKLVSGDFVEHASFQLESGDLVIQGLEIEKIQKIALKRGASIKFSVSNGMLYRISGLQHSHSVQAVVDRKTVYLDSPIQLLKEYGGISKIYTGGHDVYIYRPIGRRLAKAHPFSGGIIKKSQYVFFAQELDMLLRFSEELNKL